MNKSNNALRALSESLEERGKDFEGMKLEEKIE